MTSKLIQEYLTAATGAVDEAHLAEFFKLKLKLNATEASTIATEPEIQKEVEAPPASRAEVQVDVGAIRQNAAVIKAALTSVARLQALRQGLDASAYHVPAFMAVVKADGYGHGALQVARAAVEGGATWLGVCFTEEAVALRKGGISSSEAKILAWLNMADDDFASAISRDVDIGVSSRAVLDAVAAAARRVGKTAFVHLKVDTGMSRNGCTMAMWANLVDRTAKLCDTRVLSVRGVMTHFACAGGSGPPSVDDQMEMFGEAWRIVKEKASQSTSMDITKILRHVCNSEATLLRPEFHFDMVRVGLALHGGDPIANSSVSTPTSLTNRSSMNGDESVRRRRSRVLEQIAGLFTSRSPSPHLLSSSENFSPEQLRPAPPRRVGTQDGIELQLDHRMQEALEFARRLLRPAMTFRSKVLLVKRVEAGSRVSYGGLWTAPEATWLAIIPVGYADGVPVALTGKLQVLINGRRRPVRGRIAMDQIVADCGPADREEDVGDVSALSLCSSIGRETHVSRRVREGDEVILFGPGDRGEPMAAQWAAWSATITYEVLTGMSGATRVRRRWVGENRADHSA